MTDSRHIRSFDIGDLARAVGCSDPACPNEAMTAVQDALPGIKAGGVSEVHFYHALHGATGKKVWRVSQADPRTWRLAEAIARAATRGKASKLVTEEAELLALNHIDEVLLGRKYDPRGGASLKTFVSRIVMLRLNDLRQERECTEPINHDELHQHMEGGGGTAHEQHEKMLARIDLERQLRPITFEFGRIEVREAAVIRLLTKYVETAPVRTSSIRQAYSRNLTILADVARRSDVVLQIVVIHGFKIPTCFHISAEHARRHYSHTNATVLRDQVCSFFKTMVAQMLSRGGTTADELRALLQHVLVSRRKAWGLIVKSFNEEEEWGMTVQEESTWTATCPAHMAGSLVLHMLAQEEVGEILHPHEPIDGGNGRNLASKG